VSLTSTANRLATFLLFTLLFNLPVQSQADTSSAQKRKAASDSSLIEAGGELSDTLKYGPPLAGSATFHSVYPISPETKKKRIIINTSAHAALYVGSMLVLNQAWYADYPKSSFHTFDDSDEWLQVDKVGHAWSAYQISRVSMATWKWAGLNRKQQIWIGGLAGATFQTVIEVLDGFSEQWGWSWGDFAANCIGSGMLIGQQLAWNEQRISFKFSFHKMRYNDPVLDNRSDSLFGSSLPERALKDYNGQTYWLSANLKSFFPKSKIPAWLNVSVGYGASGMFGAFDNTWTDANGSHDLTHIPRLREWYLAPDIDFTKIPTNKKWLKTVFFILNGFKLPSPALVLSDGKLRVQGFYF
jgi:hypothetical protein